MPARRLLWRAAAMSYADNVSPEEREYAAAEFMRKFHLTATLMRFKVEREDRALPAFSVLRFPARRTAIILAGCAAAGHDCASGRASHAEAQTRLGAAERELAEGGFKVSVLWECSRMTFARSMRYLRERMPSRRGISNRPSLSRPA
jgi:G:T-mismatch repair DNA endonuclease (very short patch repair protein)